MNKKILLVIPSYSGEINDHVRKGIDEMIIPSGYEITEKVIIRTMIHTARNYAVKLALQENYDYLLFCDDDNAPKKDALKLLLEADKGIIWGIIRGRSFPNTLCVFDCEIDSDGFRKYVPLTDLPENIEDVFEVANTWTWFILYKREVLEKIRKEYNNFPFEFKVCSYIQLINGSRVELEKAFPKFMPIYKYEKDGSLKIVKMPISEDLLFHERAKYQWFKIYAHAKVTLDHYDTNWNVYIVNREDVDGCNDGL